MKRLLQAAVIFQQDGAPAHTARLAQEWLNVTCPGFIEKDQWPPNSPDLNPLDYDEWGAMQEKYHNLRPKPKTIRELKVALKLIWQDLPLEPINKTIKNFTERLRTCVVLVVETLNTSCEAISSLFDNSYLRYDLIKNRVFYFLLHYMFLNHEKTEGGLTKSDITFVLFAFFG